MRKCLPVLKNEGRLHQERSVPPSPRSRPWPPPLKGMASTWLWAGLWRSTTGPTSPHCLNAAGLPVLVPVQPQLRGPGHYQHSGPACRAILQEVLGAYLSNKAFPFSTHKLVRATRHLVSPDFVKSGPTAWRGQESYLARAHLKSSFDLNNKRVRGIC